MSGFQLRPTFVLESNLSKDELVCCIQRAFAKDPPGSVGETYHGQFTSNHAMISIDESKRRFWSPWMHLEIRDEEPRRQVHGRFSPHPSIWTGFMFSYLSIAVLIFFSIMFAVSQQMSGQTAWAWCAIPLFLVIAFLLWIASKSGQNLAREEMQQMKNRLDECVADQR